MRHLSRSLAIGVALAGMATASIAAEAEKKKGGGESYIQLPALTSTIIRPNGARGVLTVEVGLDVADGKLRERTAASAPRLRDAYVRYLMVYAAGLPPATAPNPDAIAAALQRSTDQVLAKPGAKLLVGSIMIN
jgi:hypothetical protein